jgi:aspartyl aminopeptidase
MTTRTSQQPSPSPPLSSKMLPKLNPSTTEASLKKALGFLKFVDSSPTPFHAVQTASQQLLKAGFTKISERDDFSRSFSEGKIRKGGKYFYTRNQSSLVAFALPHNVKKVRDVGMSIVAGHTDSPCPKLRPISKKTKGSYLMAGVETYGGGIWATWVCFCPLFLHPVLFIAISLADFDRSLSGQFDRDLSIAGRVIVSDGPGKTYSSRLVKIDRPLFRIPTLGKPFLRPFTNIRSSRRRGFVADQRYCVHVDSYSSG